MDSQCSLYGTILDAEMCIESPVWLYVNLIMHSLIVFSLWQNIPPDFILIILYQS